MGEQHGKPDAEAVLPDDYTVTGIFDVGYFDFDANIIVHFARKRAGPLQSRRQCSRPDGDAARSVSGAAGAATNLRALGPGYNITTWTEENSGILSALLVEKNVMFYLLFFIVLVAALCILSAQITFVVQKTREIGMLKALGAIEPANLRHFPEPERHHRRAGRAVRLRTRDAGGDLSQRISAFHAPADRLGTFSRVHLRLRRFAGDD